MSRPRKVPSYRRHKATGQAVVTLDQHDFYLGAYGSRQSHRQYQRLIREWLADGQAPTGAEQAISVDDLIARYWIHAESYYQRDGQPTGELANIRYALRP